MICSSWSVLLVDFDPQVGHEQAGRRPAIAVGTELLARIGDRAGLVLLVPCTTRDRNLAWHVPVNLQHPSFAQCEQIRAVSQRRIVGPYSHQPYISDDEREAIRAVLRTLIDL